MHVELTAARSQRILPVEELETIAKAILFSGRALLNSDFLPRSKQYKKKRATEQLHSFGESLTSSSLTTKTSISIGVSS